MPHLDVVSLAEDWALASMIDAHWQLLAKQLECPASQWRDNRGDRMYAAVLWLNTHFDHAKPVMEDDRVVQTSKITAIRKPYAISTTTYSVDGSARVHMSALTCFVKRDHGASNSKLSKVRDIWTFPDFNADRVNTLLEQHHVAKGTVTHASYGETYHVNRIQDFNNAELFYFKNYVRVARAAEWRAFQDKPRLSALRECWFFGNVDDADVLNISVENSGSDVLSCINRENGDRLFLAKSDAPYLDINGT